MKYKWTAKQFQTVSCKTRNHPQTSQTTHKPAKVPTNQSNHPQNKQTNQPNHPQTSQTTLKTTKYQTNHLLITQISHRYFPEDIFYEPQHFPCPSRVKREIDALFFLYIYNIQFTQKNKITKITIFKYLVYLKWVCLGIKKKLLKEK